MDLQERLINYRDKRAVELKSLKDELFLKKVGNAGKEESELISTDDLDRRIGELEAVINSLSEVLSGDNLEEL